MKHLLTTLLLLATLSAGAQTAATKNVDSILLANFNTTQANTALAKLTYYSPSSLAQAQQIVANVTAYIQSQVAGVTFGTAPVPPTSKYTGSKPINKANVANLTISGDSITAGTVPAITLTNCSFIHITGCKLINGTTVQSVGVLLQNCHDITIDNCYFNKVATGVYAINCSNNIVINGNQLLNMQGPYPRGQFFQFDTVVGSGNIITNNKCQNILGQSTPEDAISMYKSSGISASPILISSNEIEGGGPSKTGGGINLGDNGGNYLTASNNILVNPGQYGVQIAGGQNNTLSNNIVYGKQQSFTNVGLSVANYTPKVEQCLNATVSGNRVYWVKSDGTLNPNWNQNTCGTIAGWSTNVWNDKTVLPNILPVTLVILH